LLFSNKLAVIGTDGNDNLTGKENGLIQKLRRNLGHETGIHCVAHMQKFKCLDAVQIGIILMILVTF
jgi:hypothetical protein